MLISRCLKEKVLDIVKPVCLSILLQFKIFPGESLFSSVYTEHSMGGEVWVNYKDRITVNIQKMGDFTN